MTPITNENLRSAGWIEDETDETFAMQFGDSQYVEIDDNGCVSLIAWRRGSLELPAWLELPGRFRSIEQLAALVSILKGENTNA